MSPGKAANISKHLKPMADEAYHAQETDQELSALHVQMATLMLVSVESTINRIARFLEGDCG